MRPLNRRKFITTAAITAGSTTFPGIKKETSPTQYPLVHHVFFWLKNPGSTEDREKLIDGIKKLAKIETVKQLHVGVVADTEKRDVVEKSWSVSELLFFSTIKDQESYQHHPLHLEFVKTCGHLWEKVVVYDSMEV